MTSKLKMFVEAYKKAEYDRKNPTYTQADVLILQDKLSQYRTNHLLHFILSLFTLGLWIPVWLIVSISNANERRKATNDIRIADVSSRQVRNKTSYTNVSQSDTKRIPCRHCAELILPVAKKCPFCRTELT